MSLAARAWSLINGLSQRGFTGTRRKAARGRALYLEALEERQLMTVGPTLTAIPLTLGHDIPTPFTTAEFTSHYKDSAPLVSIIIETLPAHGSLTVAGSTINAGDILSASAISTMIYTPDAGYVGVDAFAWNASDGTNNAAQNSGVDISVVETPPVIGNVTLTTSHSQPITFTASDFTGEYGDAEGDALASITLTSNPLHGTLLLSGVAVTLNTPIAAADIGSLTYTPNPTYKGADSFMWSASDGLESSLHTANVSITVQETAPTISSFNMVPGENEAVSFLNGSSDLFSLQFSDVDAGDSLQSIKILSLPAHGTLTTTPDGMTFTPVVVGQVISAADIPDLVYTPNANYIGKDSFKWTASDGALFAAISATANFDVRYFTVTANNNVLTNGDMSPTAAAYTDFGYDSTTGPSLTRTFTISDVGSQTLNLTGVGGLVKISGADAGDFVVTTQPSLSTLTNIDDNPESTTFTITFTPSAAGTRTALVSIANSAPGLSPFTFAIKGTGLVTFTTADGLIVQQTKAGTGTGAVAFDELAVNYTGTLLDGTVFDSSLSAGRTPLQFALGQGQVIAGWDEGLENIKVGETRVLIIPSALGYGDAGSGTSIPPDATLIFVVTCLQIARPEVVITGNNELMTAGDNSPSLLDGTNFGTLAASSTSDTETFVITDGGGGILGFPSTGPSVDVTTTSSSSSAIDPEFVASGINFDPSGSSANFTLTFQPTGPGVRTAFVHVFTNDPTHPDFEFEVQGTINYTDLSASLGALTLPPPAATLGGNTTLLVPVVVTNVGALPVPSATPNATITVTVQDTVNDSDPLVFTFPSQNVSGLGLNKTKTFSEKISLPAGFDADNAIITAVISADALRPIVETNPISTTPAANNTVTATLASDLVGSLVSTTLLPQVIINAPQNGNVVFTIKNSGNAGLSSSQKVNIVITAVPTSGAAITLANLANQSIGSLAGGASKTFTVTVGKNIAFPAGTYQIQVLITPAPGILGEDSSNNVISQTGAGLPLTITSSAGFDNITGALVSSTLPASAGNTVPVKGNVVVQIQNGANRALPSGQQVQVQIIAHNLDTTTDDIVLGTSATISLSSWAANKSQSFSVPVNYTGGLDVDNYQIEARIIPLVQTGKPALVESSTVDNLLTTTSNGTTITYDSQTPANDFAVNVLTSSIASKAANTALSGTVAVRILNAGNIPLPSIQQFTIQIIAHLASDDPTDHDNDIVLQTSVPLSLANLAAGAAVTENIKVSYAPGLATNAYQIQALITPVQALSEVNPLDNYGTVTLSNTALGLTIT